MQRFNTIRVLTVALMLSLAVQGPAAAAEVLPASDTGAEVETEAPIETEAEVETEAPIETEAPAETEAPVETESESESDSETETEEASETETESQAETEAPEETETEETEETEDVEESEETEETEDEMTEELAVVEKRMRYGTKLPIDGIPEFITQEMVAYALKSQEENGYPASVTIAQIIVESGFGKYGDGGSKNQGLTQLAFKYSNLFAMTGKGTNGSVTISAEDMPECSINAPVGVAYKSYNTYAESMADRDKLVKVLCGEAIRGTEDADTFAVCLAEKWTTDKSYSLKLIKAMRDYDLYRLDTLTYEKFSELIGTFANPCPGSHISSKFGYREFDHKKHLGLDLATNSMNIPTYAVDDGKVTYVGYGKSTGNMIVINHGNGLVTKYMHHAEMYVEVGQEVFKGQQIGLTGTTGRSTGIHLHFQVEKNGEAVNPLIYLKDEGTGKNIGLKRERTEPITAVPALEIPGAGMPFAVTGILSANGR